jgi:hypothetical protein
MEKTTALPLLLFYTVRNTRRDSFYCDNMAIIWSHYNIYKKATGVALQWLWHSVKATDGTPNPTFKTTSEIVSAAETARVNENKVPRYVIVALRKAIEYRWRVFEDLSSTQSSADVEMKARNERHKAFIIRYVKGKLTLISCRSLCKVWRKQSVYCFLWRRRRCRICLPDQSSRMVALPTLDTTISCLFTRSRKTPQETQTGTLMRRTLWMDPHR